MSCSGAGCYVGVNSAWFGSNGSTVSATARVLVPGSGQYRLRYRIRNDGGPPNSWQVRIGSVDNSFSTMVLESFEDSDSFDWTERELPFSLPLTPVVTLTFEARQVCQGDHNPPSSACLDSPVLIYYSMTFPLVPTENSRGLWTTVEVGFATLIFVQRPPYVRVKLINRVASSCLASTASQSKTAIACG